MAWLNAGLASGRRRYTLAHELGHHVFQDAYSTDWALGQASHEGERLINAFAVHLLLPRRSLAKDWEELGGPERPREAGIQLAAEYRVSWTVICNQLARVGLLDAQRRAELVAWRPSQGDYLAMGLRVVEELESHVPPSSYSASVLSAYRVGRISQPRALELLWDTIRAQDLPPVDAVPLEALWACSS